MARRRAPKRSSIPVPSPSIVGKPIPAAGNSATGVAVGLLLTRGVLVLVDVGVLVGVDVDVGVEVGVEVGVPVGVVVGVPVGVGVELDKLKVS